MSEPKPILLWMLDLAGDINAYFGKDNDNVSRDSIAVIIARHAPPALDAELLRDCDCGHDLATHTFSIDFIGCDKCGRRCRRSILEIIHSRLAATQEAK